MSRLGVLAERRRFERKVRKERLPQAAAQEGFRLLSLYACTKGQLTRPRSYPVSVGFRTGNGGPQS